MPPSTQSMIPGTGPKRINYTKYLVPVALVLGVLLICGLVYALFRYTPLGTSIAEAWGIASMPAELRHGLFMSEEKDGVTTVYHVDGVSLVGEKQKGTVISGTKTEKSVALIIRDVSSVYHITLDGTEVYATSTPIKGLALSPSGNDVVFSARTDPREVIPAPVYLVAVQLHPAAWDIFLLHAKQQGFTAHLGAGTAPSYVDDTHVTWISPVGIAMADTKTGIVKILESRMISSYPAAILVSPNRTALGLIGTSTKSFDIFKLAPDSVEKTASFTYTGTVTSYALGNQSLYTLSNNGTRTQIVKQDFASPKQSVVGKIPQRFHIARVLVGSL